VRIELIGYETETHAIAPEDGAAIGPITLKPESHPRGSLMVDADAPAEVWVDDQNTGFVTPTAGILVGVGVHRVELRTPDGRRSAPARIVVRRGETLRLVLKAPLAAP
jgi:hypothetical protein